MFSPRYFQFFVQSFFFGKFITIEHDSGISGLEEEIGFLLLLAVNNVVSSNIKSTVIIQDYNRLVAFQIRLTVIDLKSVVS